MHTGDLFGVRRRLVPRARAALGSIISRNALWGAVVATAMLLPMIAITAYSNSWFGNEYGPAEMALFGPTGRNLLEGHWSAVFSNPITQGGPFELAPYGVAEILRPHGTLQWTVFYTAATLLLTLLFLVAVVVPMLRSCRRNSGIRYVALAAGAAACLGGAIPHAFDVGHPSQLLIPVMWVMAACAARDGRFATAGALIGLSTGWEVWGMLGAPVIFCAMRPRLARAALGGLAAVTLIYGPFVATRHFRMFQFHWNVSDATLVHLLRPELTAFPWTYRLLQASFALGAGTAVAFVTRRTAYSPWLVAMTVLSARLLLDPLMYPYYWLAPASLAIAAAAFSVYRRNPVAIVFSVGVAVWLRTAESRTIVGTAALLVLVGVVVPLAVPVVRWARARVPSIGWASWWPARLGSQSS